MLASFTCRHAMCLVYISTHFFTDATTLTNMLQPQLAQVQNTAITDTVCASADTVTMCCNTTTRSNGHSTLHGRLTILKDSLLKHLQHQQLHSYSSALIHNVMYEQMHALTTIA